MKKMLSLLLILGSVSVVAQTIAVSADQLVNAYQSNGYAAEQKYAGKIISVAGVVQSVGESALGTPRVTLNGGVVLSIADNQSDNLDQLQADAQITANCTVSGGTDLPLLTACELPGTSAPHHDAHRWH